MLFGNINILMSRVMREDIIPTAVFFGLFALIYFVGWPIFRHLPHRKNKILNEALRDTELLTPEKSEEDDEGEDIVLNISTDDIIKKEKEGS